MLSSRLNNQLKPSLTLILDENVENSSIGFQIACAYACELVNKVQSVNVILTEHDQGTWFQSRVVAQCSEIQSKMNVIDLFDDRHTTKPVDQCLSLFNEKSLIVIESLPWLLLRMSQGDLCRLLHQWSETHLVMAVLPLNSLEENPPLLKNLSSIAYLNVRIGHVTSSNLIETRVEQRIRTGVEPVKSFLRFALDKQLNVSQLREERMSNRKQKATTQTDNSSKVDVTANLTFNLRLKDDELTAKNNLVLPYTKQQQATSDENFTIHYSYDKEDDIDEDEDEDLTLKKEGRTMNPPPLPPVANDAIRSDLIDTAVSFLKNPKVIFESMEKKRAFLQKKGLTDKEIDYAFRIIPQQETNNSQVVSTVKQPSFLRRLLSDLIVAGLIGYVFKWIQRYFRPKKSSQTSQLNETIQNLQRTVQDMQTSVKKLEQTAEQLHLSSLNGNASSSTVEEIKREIQILKGLFLNRSQFPSIPSVPTRIPSWQLEGGQKAKGRTSLTTASSDEMSQKNNQDDNESIVVIPDQDKKSDDEHRLSTSPSSESANEA